MQTDCSLASLPRILAIVCSCCVPIGDVAAQQSQPAGGQLLWVKKAGGSLGDYVYDVVAHTDGSIFITGEFWGSATFATGTTLISNGEADCFLAKYSGTGSLLWAKRIGGLYSDRGIQVELAIVSGVLSVIVHGTGFGTVSADGATPLSVYLGYESAFNVVYSISGSLTSIAAESPQVENFKAPPRRVTLSSGKIECGWFDFGLPMAGQPLTSHGGRDFYLAQFDVAGAALWALGGGGSGSDWATAVAKIPNANSVVVVGMFERSATFPTKVGSPQTVNAAGTPPPGSTGPGGERPDIFIAKYAIQ